MINLNSIKKQTLDIISFGLGARILNFFKGILIAYYIGANYKTDIYLVAFSASMLLTTVISDGLIVSLIPTYLQIDKRDGTNGRYDFTNNLLNSFILISLALVAIGMIIAPITIKIFAPGFHGDEVSKAIFLLRLGLPIMTFHFIRAISAGYLQSQHKFRAGAKSGVVNSVVYIIYLVFFSRTFGLEGLMIAGIIAVIGQIYVLMKAVFKDGYKYRFYYFFKDRLLIRIISFLLPVMIGIGVNQVNAAVDNAVGSVFHEGTVAELNYADGIITLLVGIFIVAIVMAIFPILAENKNKEDHEELNNTIRFGLRLLTIISVPASVILIILAEPIVKLFYERGEFGALATVNTSELLVYYSIGILGMSLILLIARIYYSIDDTKTPLILGLVALTLNIILDLVLIKFIGAKGIALGTSLSVLATSGFGIYDLNTKLSFLKWKQTFTQIFKILLASVIMASVISIININLGLLLGSTFIGNLIMVIVASVLGIVIFSSILYITQA